jgi:RNA polymerase sigma-70 factor, ECF subfamily
MAEELTSDTFFKAVQQRHTFRGATFAQYKTWILSIAYHAWIDQHRTEHQSDDLEVATETIGAVPDYASSIDASEQLARALQYLENLGPPKKEVILMAIWDDLPYKEIALITGLSLANIKKIVSRTLPDIAAHISAFLPAIFLFF